MNEKGNTAKIFDWPALADGHPAKAFHFENMALAGLLDDLEAKMDQGGDVAEICRLFSSGNGACIEAERPRGARNSHDLR